MTTPNSHPPLYTDRPWAKADRDNPGRIHLLAHHLADVGACFEQRRRQPAIHRRLAYSGGLERLDETTAARLAVFAALHDIGKVNAGFQTQIWRQEDWPGPCRILAAHSGTSRVYLSIRAAGGARQGRIPPFIL